MKRILVGIYWRDVPTAVWRRHRSPEHNRAVGGAGVFKKGEIADICAHHLGVDGELKTRELAERVLSPY